MVINPLPTNKIGRTAFTLSRCKVPTLLVNYVERGVTTHHHPTSEDSLLDFPHWVRLLSDLCSCLQSGRRVLIQ